MPVLTALPVELPCQLVEIKNKSSKWTASGIWTWYINVFKKPDAVAVAQRKLKQSMGSK